MLAGNNFANFLLRSYSLTVVNGKKAVSFLGLRSQSALRYVATKPEAVPKIREIVIDRQENDVTVSGRLKEGATRRLRPVADPANTTDCPICKYNINVKMEDVLILRQFIDHNHNLFSQEETGICDDQYEKLVEAVRLAQANNFLPRPKGFQMPYRFSERVSMQNVQINFLPHREKELLVKGKFGLDLYED